VTFAESVVERNGLLLCDPSLWTTILFWAIICCWKHNRASSSDFVVRLNMTLNRRTELPRDDAVSTKIYSTTHHLVTSRVRSRENSLFMFCLRFFSLLHPKFDPVCERSKTFLPNPRKVSIEITTSVSFTYVVNPST